MLAILFVGCNASINDDLPNGLNASESGNDTEVVSSDINEMPKDTVVQVRSLVELNEMREVMTSGDEQRIGTYIKKVSNGDKNDVLKFLKIVDKIPYLELIDGEVVWIARYVGVSVDTGKAQDVLFISTRAESGEFTRVEYMLGVTDFDAQLSSWMDGAQTDVSGVLQPIVSKKEPISVHFEKVTPDFYEDGYDSVEWVMKIDGMFVRVAYKTLDASRVSIEQILSNKVFSDKLAK